MPDLLENCTLRAYQVEGFKWLVVCRLKLAISKKKFKLQYSIQAEKFGEKISIRLSVDKPTFFQWMIYLRIIDLKTFYSHFNVGRSQRKAALGMYLLRLSNKKRGSFTD